MYVSMQKTSQFKTQCKGDISHAFETAKITTNDAICAGEQERQKVKKER